MAIFINFKKWLSQIGKSQSVAVSKPQTFTGTGTTTYTLPTAAAGLSGQVLTSTGINISSSCIHGLLNGACGYCNSFAGGFGGAGGGVGASGGFTWSTPAIGGAGGSSMIVQTLSYLLSKEEEEELKLLEEEYVAATKIAKINKFKELHPEMRQMIIAHLIWQDQREIISKTEADKSDRLVELKQKQVMSRSYGITGQCTNINNPIYTTIALPEGLSKEDMIEAHTAATMEEELLKDETQS
jgi:hypothetical protein